MFNQVFKKYPTKLIDYEKLTILDKIGSGATGTVYRTKLNDKKIIGKFISMEDYEYSEDLVNDVKHELYIYEKLEGTKYCCEWIGISAVNTEKENKFIILLKDYDVDGDVYDFLNNDDIWSRINKKDITKELKQREYIYSYNQKHWVYHLDRNTKIDITQKLCLAVSELQSRNIVHCDMKTGNMLYNPTTKELILIDFNASHKMNNNRKFNIITKDRGTIGYVCEDLNYGYCSLKSDIYSLAVCILEVWCGGIWKDGKNYKESRLDVLSSLRNLSMKEPELGKILRNCINLNVEKRPKIKKIINKINKLV